MRLPYQSDPTCRKQINAGEMQYTDMHLSHVAQFVWFGFLGKLDVAVVEVRGILPDGRLIPSSSVGNNKTWLDQADKIILEVNTCKTRGLEGMHDIYYGTAPAAAPPADSADRPRRPHRRALPDCDLSKVIAVVETHQPDRNSAFAAPDENSRRIAGHIIEFLQHEVATRPPAAELLPLQSGVGNIANAVLAGLNDGAVQGPDRLHRSAAGRHAGHAALGQAGDGVGHGAVVQPATALADFNDRHRLLPRAHRAARRRKSATTPSGAPPGRDRHERA